MRNLSLSEPVHGICTADGALVEADAALLRLHLRAGGAEDGALALPQLRALCQSSARLGMKLARAVDASDEEADYRLLVETDPQADLVHFTITGWWEQERDRAQLNGSTFRIDLQDSTQQSHVQLDAGLRVLAFRLEDEEGCLPLPAIGQSLTEWANLSTRSDKPFLLLEAIAERQAFRDQAAMIGDHGVSLSGQPLLTGHGVFSGYLCTVKLVESPALSEPQLEPFRAQLVSPNLKQPLNRIIANAETIHGRLRGPLRENYASYARDIASAARHLRDLVDDFGDMETIEQPGFVADVERIDCCELARRAAGLLAVRAADHGIAIHAPAEQDSLAATGEYKRVLQILVNLIGNAVTYAPDGTQVSVTADILEDGRPAIVVQDQGDGIKAEDRERIFDKFERLGRCADGGSGLGLYISRSFARAMGGELSIADSDEGARFVLSLPPAGAGGS